MTWSFVLERSSRFQPLSSKAARAKMLKTAADELTGGPASDEGGGVLHVTGRGEWAGGT